MVVYYLLPAKWFDSVARPMSISISRLKTQYFVRMLHRVSCAMPCCAMPWRVAAAGGGAAAGQASVTGIWGVLGGMASIIPWLCSFATTAQVGLIQILFRVWFRRATGFAGWLCGLVSSSHVSACFLLWTRWLHRFHLLFRVRVSIVCPARLPKIGVLVGTATPHNTTVRLCHGPLHTGPSISTPGRPGLFSNTGWAFCLSRSTPRSGTRCTRQSAAGGRR